MIKIIETEKVPIKMWLEDADEATLQQAKNLANLPFVFKHIALMPDAHSGYGMPIGGVMASKDTVVPNAVGVDIGCGMCAVKTNLKAEKATKQKLKNIIGDIRSYIPLGFNHHKKSMDEKYMPQGHDLESMPITANNYTSALKQVGTLGGGNHFIEIQKDTNNDIWLMIHSGSRNIGLKVAEHYNNEARRLNKLWESPVSLKHDLAYLPIDTEEAQLYLKEMRFCVDFAFANRKLMMQHVQEVFSAHFPQTAYDELINIAHNYASWEMHFGHKVLVHRKGATSAKAGETGIIPGSQGAKSYIVEGLGNPESFMSCSHGAGRTMSRTQAIKKLNLEEEIKKLDSQGIIHGIRKQKDLDEAASAYKNIKWVMHQQSDLTKIVHELSPMAVVKG